MEKVKIYVVGGDVHYASWINNHELVDTLEEADIVMFTGGEDVDPSIYGKEKHPRTFSNLARDKEEIAEFNKIKPNQLVIGICRGSQFACVMNGGILVQHCDAHALIGTHEITNGTYTVDITSTHHQMQYPFNLDDDDYDIIYWASPLLSRYYEGDGVNIPSFEPEVVYYHKHDKPKCLAIQGHPEFMRKDAPVINLLNELVEQCLQDVR